MSDLFSDMVNNYEDEEDILVNPTVFAHNGQGYRCMPCNSDFMSLAKAARHEDTERHAQRIRDFDGRPGNASSSANPEIPAAAAYPSSPLPPSSPPDDWVPPRDRHSDNEMNPFPISPSETFTIHGPALPSDPVDQIFDDWGGNLAQAKPDRQGTEDNKDGGSLFSESSGDESDSDIDDVEDAYVFSETLSSDGIPDFAPSDGVQLPDDTDWWPWLNEKSCLMDVLGAFPRAAFSENETEITRWFATRLGVHGIPSARVVKERRKVLHQLISSNPRLLKSSLGNFYCKTTLASILAHEMSNPVVRSKMHFYPEDSGPRLAEVRQADRWLREVNATYSGPMVRVGQHDFYVDEPALAVPYESNSIPQAVLPVRFFEREGELWTTVHRLSVDTLDNGFVIEALSDADCFQFPAKNLFLNFPQLAEGHTRYDLPHPSRIIGVRRRVSGPLCGPYAAPPNTISEWSSQAPNPWRAKANGRRVLPLPMWWYCDDTSGNSSKKWNKHNSFLFVLGGLPREQVHHAYNIHFLATSNIASPLEMLEGIADELSDLQAHGLVAWDCEFKEEVLYIPWALAFLGDNPMQSELTSHVGLQGKHFCRVCHVEKSTSRTRESASERLRLIQFMTAGSPRSREDTLAALRSQWELVLGGAPSRVDSAATETGVKDKHFMAWVEMLAQKIAALKVAHRQSGVPQSLPDAIRDLIRDVTGQQSFEDLVNPIFKILELNPNADTPVEILHVILLGFVKYFWRDAVSRQNSAGKKMLKTRLSSLDVSDLGLDPLRGHTLVQYAKSLTGRDFRVIAQVAPAVLYDMVPTAAYEAWLALCRLCPLVFQPVIQDREHYLRILEVAIEDFLSATVLWNPQWFNKPKFHVLLHILRHIERFGPPILTATEGFESYNFVIRLRSILSNRQAPSVDIAQAMSHMHAVRHLVSGGFIPYCTGDGTTAYRQAGQGVRNLVQDSIFAKFMGMSEVTQLMQGLTHELKVRRIPKSSPVSWEDTLTGKTEGLRTMPQALLRGSDLVFQCNRLDLVNGDQARLHGYVLVKIPGSHNVSVGNIIEILRTSSCLLGVLIQEWTTTGFHGVYRMPRVCPGTRKWFLTIHDVLCTVHTFHNCQQNHCMITRTRATQQERSKTGDYEDEFCHTIQPQDRVLNLAQMRSAASIQVFRWPGRYPNISQEAVISKVLATRQLQQTMPPPSQSQPIATASTSGTPVVSPISFDYASTPTRGAEFVCAPRTPPRRRPQNYLESDDSSTRLKRKRARAAWEEADSSPTPQRRRN